MLEKYAIGKPAYILRLFFFLSNFLALAINFTIDHYVLNIINIHIKT